MRVFPTIFSLRNVIAIVEIFLHKRGRKKLGAKINVDYLEYIFILWLWGINLLLDVSQ